MPDPRRLAKTFGTTVPAAITAGESAAQMTPAAPFGPGTPIGPYDGYSRTPRAHEFIPGYNIASRPRSHERVSFDSLRGLIEAYDVAQMCVWHRIDSIRSLDWSLVAAPHFEGDVTDAVRVGMAALRKPDRQTPFSTWLSAYLYDVLAFDAGCLYRLRNRRGDVVGLMNVDGTSVAPLLDYWGRSPEPPAEAYVQYINGLPWNWLTRDDLIYEPFRKRPNSPYGLAPIETILLNANTDIRFQVYFLQRFTEGNIPEAFASAPESWSPDQIEQWQALWDSFMAGDQAAKHTIKWMPGGSTIAWSNEKDFTDQFSLFLMRKTAAAFHVVPSDLGFTENVNLSSGETQADVQHRVGDLPLIRHLQHTLSSFLQDDLHLPLDFLFDLGEEQADRLQQAQADQIYIQNGVVGASDIRSMRYGLEEPEGKPVPRFIYTSRGGPIPLASLYAVAGQIDPATAAPMPGTELPHTAFAGAEGVVPNPPVQVAPLAEQEYGPSALPPTPPSQPPAPDPGPAAPVAKDGVAPTAGITTATGIVGYDLVGHGKEEDDEEQQDLVKAELAAFRRFRQARRRAGQWRDFEFRSVGPVQGHRLNDTGRLAVRKAAGEVAVAGLAVRAADTGRVLMLQRALDDEDPASGCWEMPGGHLEGNESPLQGAWREWAEETGCMPPAGEQTGTWTSPDGIYQGIVWTVPSEDAVPIVGGRDAVTNPDDPDGDSVEAIAWWDPTQLPGNPAVREELLDNVDQVLAALGLPAAGDESVCPCGTPVVYDEANGWQHADGSISHDDGESISDKMRAVAKAAAPKGDAPIQGAHWPGWQHDLDTANYWSPRLATALTTALTVDQARQVADQFLTASQPADGNKQDKDVLTAAALTLLAAQGLDLIGPIASTLTGLWTDGYLIGLASAAAVATNNRPQLDEWTPGDSSAAAAQIEQLGETDGLNELLATAPGAARGIADGRRNDLARQLATGVLQGLTAAAVGATMRDALGNGNTADGIAITEITRASGIAAVAGYRRAGVAQVQWVLDPSSQTCPTCIANAAAGPIQLGAAFPSGDRSVPAHPRCRCAVLSA